MTGIAKTVGISDLDSVSGGESVRDDDGGSQVEGSQKNNSIPTSSSDLSSSPHPTDKPLQEDCYVGQGSLTPADSNSSEEDEVVSSDDDKVGRSRSPSSSSSSSASSSSDGVYRVGGEESHQNPSYVPSAAAASNVAINVFTIIGCLGVFAVFLVGSYDYFKKVERNKCDMTWMYKRPYFVPIRIGGGVDERFPLYGLYAYVEGEKAVEVVEGGEYKFRGIPVLFVHGNAGSYSQVRSLASVALWKYLDAGTPFHFDFFSVDLNEEFSALYGYSLGKQVEFTSQALVRIVNLYDEFHRVVLVGHSMGGVIAKAIAVSGDDIIGGGGLANLILTLATPHSKPVVLLDPEQDLFYYAVSRNWTRMAASSNLTLVSIAGGDRDYQVPSKLTRWSPFTTVHTISTAVPGVWASTDHLCIVWCKQLVVTLVRALFDLVEFHQRNKYYHITDDDETRREVLRYHLVERSSGKSYVRRRSGSGVISFSKSVEQVEVESGMYCAPGGQGPKYLMFPVTYLLKNSSAEDARVVILTTNTKDKHWVMGCGAESSAPSRTCTQGESLAHLGKFIPHMRRRRKMANIPIQALSKYSHVVVKMEPHPFKTCVMLETYEESERSLPLGGELISENKIFFNFTLPAYESILSYLVAWRVEARPLEKGSSCPESHHLLAQFSHGNFEQSRYLKNESLIVRYSDWNVSESTVTLYLEPTCSYRVTTRIALLETSGQVFRLLVRWLPSFYASVLLMTLYFQKDPANWSSFHVVLLSNAYHLSIFPGFCIAVGLHFIPTDWPLMVEEREYSVIVPILCNMIAYCLVLAVSSGTWYAIITAGTAFHSVLIRLLSTRLGNWIPRLFSNHRGFTSVTEHVTEAAFEMTLTRFPLTIAVLLLCLSFATCGSLGIATALVLYLVKLFKIYEDLLEDLLKAKIANVKDSLSPMNFHFSCFMLWLVLGVLNVPSLLHWTRTNFTTQPEWDLSMYLCLLLLPTVAVLWQDFVPQIEPTIWLIHRFVFYGVGLACVLWGTHRLYVTSFLIVFVFLTMALCQLVSVMMSSLLRTSTNSPSNNEQQPEAAPSPPADGAAR